jgi:squalene-hopene/tetraprenyl-beta-curcumene cyclase
LAVGIAPDSYVSNPTIQENLKMLRAYLSGQYSPQPLLNKVVLLWASTKFPGLLAPGQRAALEDTLFGLQKEDGGWSLSTLGTWERKDKTPLETKSDGYATGLTVFALEQAGIPSTRPEVKNGLSWLIKNQDQAEGLWPAYSLNKNRDLSTDTGRLMVDAATAFAVLALESAHQ